MCNKFSGTAYPGKATSGNIGFIQININWGNSSRPACPLQSVLSMCFGQKRIWHLVRVGSQVSPVLLSCFSNLSIARSQCESQYPECPFAQTAFPSWRRCITCQFKLANNCWMGISWDGKKHLNLAKIWCSTHYAHISWAPLTCVCPLREAIAREKWSFF